MVAAVEAMDDKEETLYINQLAHAMVVSYFLNFEAATLKYILRKGGVCINSSK